MKIHAAAPTGLIAIRIQRYAAFEGISWAGQGHAKNAIISVPERRVVHLPSKQKRKLSAIDHILP
jgi:hypothetical protein